MAAALSRVYAGLCRRDRLTSKECPFWLDSLFCGHCEGRPSVGLGTRMGSGQIQRRLDSRPQSIMGIERLIPRVASLTVDCRGVNISLTKPIWTIWKLSNDKSVRLRYFVKRNSMLLLYCCDHHYDLCFTISSLPFLIKLHGTCCHFSFINNPSEKRNCV